MQVPSKGSGGTATAARSAVAVAEPEVETLDHGAVVIAAITSCTNTSNPSVMIGAGLVAKKAVERGLKRQPWVKSSLAPGSKVVTEYLNAAGLTPYLDQLGFNLVGYGCTTCIGNSGPLPDEIAATVRDASGGTVRGAPVRWTSSDPRVATVDPTNGTVRAVAQGTARISARSGNVSETVTVVVLESPPRLQALVPIASSEAATTAMMSRLRDIRTSCRWI